MLQVGDKIKITLGDDKPRGHNVLGQFYAEFTGDGFLGCPRNVPLRPVRLPLYWLRDKVDQVVSGERRRCNVDCMLEQIFAENMV